jgi:hypothetical protein
MFITPAELVFTWGSVDALEVLFTAFHTAGIISVVDSVWILESIKEIILSLLTVFDHLEYKTIT